MGTNKTYSENVELIGYHNLEGKPGFQMAMQKVGGKYYLYLAHFRHSGWAIVDVTNPWEPEYLKFIPGPDRPGQGTPKIQVADGIMITALGSLHPMLHGTSPEDPFEEGIYIWDVKDPENPVWLSHWKTGVTKGFAGVHRFFYSGGRYVHLSATCPGFSGMIYRIVDIKDKTAPAEVGRWWLPEQWEVGFPKQNDADSLDKPSLHGPPYVKGNLVYCSYGVAGMIILDISDITLPKFVGQLRHHPPFGGGFGGARCHTVLPLSQKPLAVMTSEGERFFYFNKEILMGKAQPMNFIGMVDVSDPSNPTLISVFPYPKVPPDYPYKNFNEIEGVGCPGPFGPHNLHEPHYNPALEDRNDRIYCAYFHAGLRIYDISDPFVPKEIAYFIPPNPKKWAFNSPAGNLFKGPLIATVEDVLVDNRGYIYITTAHDGLYILRCIV